MWTSGFKAKIQDTPTTNDELIQLLIYAEIIKSFEVENTMRLTDRAFYAPEIDLSKCISPTYKYGECTHIKIKAKIKKISMEYSL